METMKVPDILTNGVKTIITYKTQMDRYLEWKKLITKETRSKLSNETLKDYYKIRNWLAIKALVELSK